MKQLEMRYSRGGRMIPMDLCASEMKRLTTGLLDAWRQPSLLQRLRRASGPTQQKARGSATEEITLKQDERVYYPEDAMTIADKKRFDRARRFGSLLYADGFLMAFGYKGNLYVMEPPESLRDFVTEGLEWDREQKAAHSEKVESEAVPPVGAEEWASEYYQDPHEAMKEDFSQFLVEEVDKKILEAGFGTESLRQSLQTCVTLLYRRMLSDPITGFTNEEWEAIDKAHDLLGIERKHR